MIDCPHGVRPTSCLRETRVSTHARGRLDPIHKMIVFVYLLVGGSSYVGATSSWTRHCQGGNAALQQKDKEGADPFYFDRTHGVKSQRDSGSQSQGLLGERFERDEKGPL